MSSRKFTMMGRMIAIVVALALVIACAAQAAAPVGDPSAAKSPAVPRARTLIVMAGPANQYTQFNNHNPFTPASYDAFHVGTLPAMVEPLIMFNVLTGKYENWLAESWAYNDNFTELTLKLRTGIRWDDGEPLTADDVVYSFNMMRDNAAGMVNLADLPAFLEEAVKVDDLTVKLVLKRPNPTFWASTLSTNHSPVIVPKHIWADKEPLEFTNFDLAAGLPVGSGPFKLVAASPQQKIYDRRADWWAVETGFKTLPNVERIIYLPQQDESQAAQLLINNQLDMGPIVQMPTLKVVLAQNPKITMFTGQKSPYGYRDWCPTELNLNASEPPYDDKEIRWAVNYAIDRQKLVDLAEAGAGVAALHPFSSDAWFNPYTDALKEIFAKYEYDTAAHLDKVDAIMTSKGYSKNADGLWTDSGDATFVMNIFVPDWLKPYGPPLIQQLRDAGFDATFDTSPGLLSAVLTGEQREGLVCKGPSGVRGMDPYFMLSIYLSQYFRSTGEPAANWWATSRWQNAEYDALVEQMALLSPDDPQTMDLFKQAMDIWVSEMPDIFVAQLIIRYPMNTTYWINWPTQENVYGLPHSWQHEFMKTLINLQPVQ